MFTKYLLPAIAMLGFIFAVRVVIINSAPVVPAPPAARPSVSPFKYYVSGAGLVEASSENVAISTHISGVVTEVYVSVGQEVKAGDPLFKIDDRQEQANLNVQLASLATAKINMDDAKTQFSLVQNLNDRRAVSIDEFNKKKFAASAFEARYQQAEAEVAATRTTLERLITRSPIDATILQVKVRAGEFAQAGVLATPLILLGSTQTLSVRVDVDENDAWRVKPGSHAEAFLRGNTELHTALAFNRFEPYVIPKRSLTGESSERVDTRVLQVIYNFPKKALNVFAGQLMDVYIEVKPEPSPEPSK